MAGRAFSEAPVPVVRGAVTVQRHADSDLVLAEQVAVLAGEPDSVGVDSQIHSAPSALDDTAQNAKRFPHTCQP